LKEKQETNEFVAWSKQRGGPYMPTPIVYGDYFYVCSNNGVVTAYNAKTGERVYQERIAGKGGAFTASPVAADDKLYFSSEDGEVFVVRAGAKHELLATNPMGEPLMATPAISGGMVIVRGQHHLFGIGEPAAPARAPKAKAAK
jgi:outer membrane protein assembly factor BamB